MFDIEDIQTGTIQFGEWRQEPASAFAPLIHQEGNRQANAALTLRDELCNYFNNIIFILFFGKIEWYDEDRRKRYNVLSQILNLYTIYIFYIFNDIFLSK